MSLKQKQDSLLKQMTILMELHKDMVTNPAYWFYKNKGKLKTLEKEAKKFLKENPDIKKLLNEYFSENNWIWALKDRRELSFDTLITELRDDSVENRDIINKIEGAKHLWKSMMYVIECR